MGIWLFHTSTLDRNSVLEHAPAISDVSDVNGMSIFSEGPELGGYQVELKSKAAQARSKKLMRRMMNCHVPSPHT